MHGTRSILSVTVNGNPNNAEDGQGVNLVLGIFESIETGVTHDHFEPFILGRASAGEIIIMGQAPISVRLSGYRKVAKDTKFGPHGNANVDMNKLQEILADAKDLQIQVVDRQTEAVILRVNNAKCVSHNLAIAAKQPARINIELVGLTFEDDDGAQSEMGVAY